jgi:hypothetical protein
MDTDIKISIITGEYDKETKKRLLDYLEAEDYKNIVKELSRYSSERMSENIHTHVKNINTSIQWLVDNGIWNDLLWIFRSLPKRIMLSIDKKSSNSSIIRAEKSLLEAVIKFINEYKYPKTD